MNNKDFNNILKKEDYFLSTQDIIDWHDSNAGWAVGLNEQIFLMSRFYKIPLEDIKKLEYKYTMILMKKLEEYMTDIENHEASYSEALKAIKRTTKNKTKNRFDILDIR